MSSWQRLDVLLVEVEWRTCTDRRPGIVVNVFDDQSVGCALVSSAMDLFQERDDFMVEREEAGFETTGLLRTSFATSRHVQRVEPGDVVRKLGFLSHDLRAQFSAWWFLVLCLRYIKSREIKEEHRVSVFHEFGKLLI